MKKSKATEALRVASDVAAIRAALHKHGYRLRKQPKQPVWKAIANSGVNLCVTCAVLLPFPLKKYLFFLQTTEYTPDTPGKHEIGNLGVVAE